MCAESIKVATEPVTRSGLPEDLPMDWILTKRDRALRPRLQRQFISSLGGVDNVFELDTCHDAMISEPTELAKIILGRC